jgi:heat shock protein HtpX
MKRVARFVATNIAFLLALSAAAQLLGVDAWLATQGSSLTGLLMLAALFGFGGAFRSLALSKWMAPSKRASRHCAEAVAGNRCGPRSLPNSASKTKRPR